MPLAQVNGIDFHYETQPLPANNAYDFVAFCRNPVADCTFTLTLTATY